MDNNIDKYVTSKCTWQSNMEDKHVNDSLVTHLKGRNESHNFNSDNFDELAQLQTHINIIKPDTGEFDKIPQIVLNVNPQWKYIYIDAITLICEVQTVEVFGSHMMYLETTHGHNIMDESMPIYQFHINLPGPLKECSLKLIPSLKQDQIWIFRIDVFLNKNKTVASTSINYDNVEKLLKNTNLSENATNCMNFLKLASVDANELQSTSSGQKCSLHKPTATESTGLQDNSIANLPEIKTYIDLKFQELRYILEYQNRKINEKLNSILEIVKHKADI